MGISHFRREQVFSLNCAIVGRAHSSCLATTGYAVVHQQLFFLLTLPRVGEASHVEEQRGDIPQID